MKTLQRVLRLRSIFEEISRTELAAEAERARRLETVADQNQAAAMRYRRESFEGVCRAETEEWLLAEAAREMTEWQMRQLEPLVEEQSARMASAMNLYFEKRNERRQVETLIENQQTDVARQQERREQQELDEWFAIRVRRRGMDRK